MSRAPSRPPRGFAAIEMLALAVVFLVLLSLLIVGMHDARRSAMLGRDLANLRQMGSWTGSYGADNRDLFWSFSWEPFVMYNTPWPELNWAETRQRAHMHQAVYLMRSRGGMPDMPGISKWIPHVYFSHLVLAEYLDAPLADLRMISAGDEHRLTWAKDPEGFRAGAYLPNQPQPTSTQWRWVFSSSFVPPAAFYDRAEAPYRISQAQHFSYFVPPQADLGQTTLSDVAHPSRKAMLSDQSAWHFGRPRYISAPGARAPVLMADGSADVRATADSNPGWRPNQPADPRPTLYVYQPRAWEPPTTTGLAAEAVTGHYRWTRGGLEGIDFGGPEINTGQR